jgi:hypothetical protein
MLFLTLIERWDMHLQFCLISRQVRSLIHTPGLALTLAGVLAGVIVAFDNRSFSSVQRADRRK